MKLRGAPEQNESGEGLRPSRSQPARTRSDEPQTSEIRKDPEVQSLRLRQRIEGEGQVPDRGREGGKGVRGLDSERAFQFKRGSPCPPHPHEKHVPKRAAAPQQIKGD